jgi:hypothetical protein
MFFSACSMNSLVNADLFSYIESKNSMSEVIHRFARDSDVVLEINWECFDVDDEFDRFVTTFTAVITLCWIKFDNIFMSIFCIIFCIRSEQFACCSVIFVSLNEEKIIEWNDSLWFLNVSEWRFFSFCNIISKISFRILSICEISLDDSAKFWKDSDNSLKSFVNDSMFLRSSVNF